MSDGNAHVRGGAVRHALKDRKDDLNETPPAATRALMRAVNLPQNVWEPCAGRNAITNVITATGRRVVATDLVDYGVLGIQTGVDFLMEHKAPEGCDTIVTNLPFKTQDAMVRHGLQLCSVVIVLQRLAYLEGAKRADLIDHHLSRVLVGIERLPMMHRDGWQGERIKQGTMPFAWFVFTRLQPRQTVLERISWRGE